MGKGTTGRGSAGGRWRRIVAGLFAAALLVGAHQPARAFLLLSLPDDIAVELTDVDVDKVVRTYVTLSGVVGDIEDFDNPPNAPFQELGFHGYLHWRSVQMTMYYAEQAARLTPDKRAAKRAGVTAAIEQAFRESAAGTVGEAADRLHRLQFVLLAIGDHNVAVMERHLGRMQEVARQAIAQDAPTAVTAADTGDLAPLATFRDCPTCPEMVVLPTGTFVMGATKQEQRDMFIGVVPAEHPAHDVTIGHRVAIGRFEVTTDEFDAWVQETGASVGGTCGIRLIEKGPLARKFTGTRHPDDGKDAMGPYHVFITDGSYARPGLPVTGRQPAVCVSRAEIEAYLAWLSAKTGRAYRLPSEAEWEYAARAGTRTIGFWGDDFAGACRHANFGDRKSGYQAGMAAPCAEAISPAWTAEVGSYAPNPWGLFDMAGNVQELTADCWHDSYDGAPADGSAWTEEGCRLFVARGGDYELLHISMRASERLFYGYVANESTVEGENAGRDGRSNVLGFRVAVTLD